MKPFYLSHKQMIATTTTTTTTNVQIEETTADLHKRIDLRRDEMIQEVTRGSLALKSMIKCTHEKLQSIATVYGIAEEICGSAIHTYAFPPSLRLRLSRLIETLSID